MHDEVEDLIRRYLFSFAGGDPNEIASHVTDDFVNEHTAALGESSEGRVAYEARLGSFLAEMVGLRYEIEDLVVSDRRAMVAYTLTARWKGERSVTVRGMQRLEVRGAMIARRIDYWDAAGFLVQVDAEAAAALARFGIRSR